MAIDPEHVITLSGKRVVLYKGLLALAHEAGLRSIQTELIQVPSPDNGNVAIMRARVYLTDDRLFEGYGDANPGNTSGAMAKALIRMAETRAKARALRDAVNIGDVSLEELADDDEPAARPLPQSTRTVDNGHSKATVPAPVNAATDREALIRDFSIAWARSNKAGFEPTAVTREEIDTWDDAKILRETKAMVDTLAAAGKPA